jgi:bifunctional enzyme CysN/CysC
MLMDGYRVVGGGILSMEGFTDQRVAGVQNIFAPDGHVTKDQRALINGHEGGVIWLNGYYGSGKNAISKALEKRLFAKGYHVVVLDQENIDKGLNKDLDLTHEGRSEAIRRVGEVAGLMAKSGMIVISALMAPYSEDRRRIRNMMPESFHSVFLSADIDACRARDTKGVYAKADKGDITLPGVNADFEVPENADLIIDTGAVSVDEAVSLIEHYIERQLIEPVKAMTDIGGGI